VKIEIEIERDHACRSWVITSLDDHYVARVGCVSDKGQELDSVHLPDRVVKKLMEEVQADEHRRNHPS